MLQFLDIVWRYLAPRAIPIPQYYPLARCTSKSCRETSQVEEMSWVRLTLSCRLVMCMTKLAPLRMPHERDGFYYKRRTTSRDWQNILRQ